MERTERIKNKCCLLAGGFVAPNTDAVVALFMKEQEVFVTTVVSSAPKGSPLEVVQDICDEFDGSLEDFDVKVFVLCGEVHGRDLAKQ